MRRYMLFSGDNYYPNGGMDDFISSYTFLDDAKIKARALVNTDVGSGKWAHIFDLKENKIIFTI